MTKQIETDNIKNKLTANVGKSKLIDIKINKKYITRKNHFARCLCLIMNFSNPFNLNFILFLCF